MLHILLISQRCPAGDAVIENRVISGDSQPADLEKPQQGVGERLFSQKYEKIVQQLKLEKHIAAIDKIIDYFLL